MQFVTQLLDPGHNRPGTGLLPSGIVLHSTDDLSATSVDIRNYFNNNPQVQASAHLVVDWTQAVTMIPWQPGQTELAWHAGPTANHRYLGIEWCETDDPALFGQGYANYTATVRTILDWYRWPVDAQHVFSHAQISSLYHETDHTDPLPYLARHNKTWDQLAADIAAAAITPFPVLPGGAAPAGPAAAGQGDPSLVRQGDTGPAVQEIQARLAAMGLNPGSVDGVFGPQTAAAVVAFQRAAGLSTDGIVGPETLAKLRAS